MGNCLRIMIAAILLLLGFIPLIWGADMLVNGASAIAKKFKVSDLVVGLTIVAFGTSAPELVVNVISSVNNSTQLAVANVVGSNIFNIAFILGMTAMITPLAVKQSTTWIEIPLVFLASLILLVMCSDHFLDAQTISLISRSEGLILLFFMTIFLAYNFQIAKSSTDEEELDYKDYSLLKSILFVLIGLALLIVGGQLIVTNAISVAVSFAIPERIIGLTIVSIGTSLPELATSLVAAKKNRVDMAIGNVVGSNIFNVFLILGISSLITPLSVSEKAYPDLLVNIVLSALLFIFMFTGKGRQLERWEGFVLLVLYVSYTMYLIFL